MTLHESQQTDFFLLSGCAVPFSRRSAESLGPTDAWELFWHPQGQMIKDGLKGSCRMICQWAGSNTPQFRNNMWGSPCTAATSVREGRKGKLFAMDFCKHIRELCWHPTGPVGHVISAGCKHKTFLHCLQLHTRRDKTPSATKTSLRHQKENLRFRTIQTHSELFL